MKNAYKAKNNTKNSLNLIQRKISITQISIILSLSFVLAVCGIFINIRFQQNKIDKNLQNISETISSSPLVKNNDLNNNAESSGEILSSYLDSLKKTLSDVDVISIVNKSNERFYHTNHKLIGTDYDGEQPIFSSDRSFYIVDADGPSGKQRRAYSALYDNEGNYIGFIMVIILKQNLYSNFIPTVIAYCVLTLCIIAVELLLSSYFSKNIKKSLLGFEPDAISAMYIVRDNILESLDEGVIAVDNEGLILFANSAFLKIVDSEETLSTSEIVKRRLERIPNGKLVKKILSGKDKALNIHEQNSNGIDVLVDRIPLKSSNESVATIGIFHNRAEYTKLMEDLTGTRYLVESMRANNHDFTNKLHVILGLIQMEMYEQAKEYIENISFVQRSTISKIMNSINEPSLAALLIGKNARASELNIKFIIKEGSHYSNSDFHIPYEMLITIVGNLIENSFESINEKKESIDVKNELRFGIYSKQDSLIISVDDSGSGIPENDIPHIFENGFSTKGKNRGTGLFQVKNLVDSYNGEIFVQSKEHFGTSFSISFSK